MKVSIKVQHLRQIVFRRGAENGFDPLLHDHERRFCTAATPFQSSMSSSGFSARYRP